MSPVNTLSLQRPIIKIGGSELSAAHLDALIDLHVETGIRSIGRAVLRLSDPGYRLSGSGNLAALESSLTITDTARATYFEGEVVERAVSYTEDAGTVLEIVALDRAHRLTNATVIEAKQKQNLADALRSLLSTHGLRGSITATTDVFEWTAVTGSALSIIDEVAERYGFDWTVRGTEFHLWDAATGSPDSTPVHLRLGTDLSDFGVRVAMGRNHEVTVRGWNGANQTAVVGTATTPADRNSSDFLTGKSPTVKVQRSDLVPTQASDADRLAKAAAASASRSIARGRGRLNTAIAPGVTIEVKEAGVSSGRFYVREVEHVLTSTGGWTRFVAGDRDAPRLVDRWDGAPHASTFTHHSALIGIVTQVHESEPTVKLKLPVIGEQFETSWARVLMLGAGPGTGLFVMPEILDEVLVLFPDGDLRHPVVLGGLHSEKRLPTTRAKTRGSNKAVEARAWASKQEHFVELADGSAPARQHVKLGLGNGDQYVRVGKDKVEISAPTDVPIRIGNPNAWIELGTDGSITLSGKSVKIQSNGAIELEGLTIKAVSKSSVAIEARTGLTLKATSEASLEAAAGIAKVKGMTVQIN